MGVRGVGQWNREVEDKIKSKNRGKLVVRQTIQTIPYSSRITCYLCMGTEFCSFFFSPRYLAQCPGHGRYSVNIDWKPDCILYSSINNEYER